MEITTKNIEVLILYQSVQKDCIGKHVPQGELYKIVGEMANISWRSVLRIISFMMKVHYTPSDHDKKDFSNRIHSMLAYITDDTPPQ